MATWKGDQTVGLWEGLWDGWKADWWGLCSAFHWVGTKAVLMVALLGNLWGI